MNATAPDARPATEPATPAEGSSEAAWMALLTVLAALVALGDVVFMALIPTIIPPLLLGNGLTLIGLALVRARPRTAATLLGLTSLVLGLVSIAFLGGHLAHPGSAVDLLHSMLAIVGRGLAVVAAIGALRGADVAGARRVAASGLGLASIAVVAAAMAFMSTNDEAARPGDVAVVIADSRFPEVVVAEPGQTLHLDNRDLFRHTFTVPGTDLDVDLPATSAARATVELAAGTYEVICDIPGHEHMRARLVVG